MRTASIFKSGNSQAVRLPKDFRFDVREVEILRRGKVCASGARLRRHVDGHLRRAAVRRREERAPR